MQWQSASVEAANKHFRQRIRQAALMPVCRETDFCQPYSKPPVRAVINKEFNSQTPCWAPCAKGIFKRKKFCQGQSPKRLRSFFAPPKHSRTKNWTPTRHRSTSKAPQGLSFLSLMPILKAIHHLAIRTFQNCQLKSSQAR